MAYKDPMDEYTSELTKTKLKIVQSRPSAYSLADWYNHFWPQLEKFFPKIKKNRDAFGQLTDTYTLDYTESKKAMDQLREDAKRQIEEAKARDEARRLQEKENIIAAMRAEGVSEEEIEAAFGDEN